MTYSKRNVNSIIRDVPKTQECRHLCLNIVVASLCTIRPDPHLQCSPKMGFIDCPGWPWVLGHLDAHCPNSDNLGIAPSHFILPTNNGLKFQFSPHITSKIRCEMSQPHCEIMPRVLQG